MNNTSPRPRCFAPTPADLAQRAARPRPTPQPAVQPVMKATPIPAQDGPTEPPRLGDSVAPGILRRRERLRPAFQQAMRISRMHPNTRLVALTYLGYAHYETGLIRWHPAPAELAYATGLTEGQVLVQMEILTQRGWLQMKPLPAGARAGQLAPQLSIPAPVLEQVRARVHLHLPPD